jgi:hypothetical protein
MVNKYRRAARTAEELELGALHPLDRAIPELAADDVQRVESGGGGQQGGQRREPEKSPAAADDDETTNESESVAPPGLEPGRYFYRGILSPLRLPFRQGATRVV